VRIIAKRGKRSRAVQLGLAGKRTWEELKGKEAGGFAPEGEQYSEASNATAVSLHNAGWIPYHNDMADAVGWIYGGHGRRMQLANAALYS
jgi:hypothetical protein